MSHFEMSTATTREFLQSLQDLPLSVAKERARQRLIEADRRYQTFRSRTARFHIGQEMETLHAFVVNGRIDA